MTVHYRTLGIILKKGERDEADQIFTIYTKDFGKLSVLGRGIRKATSKLRSGIELFYFSEIEFIQGKAQKTLTDAILIDRFDNLRKELKRLTLAFKVAKILDRFTQKQEPDKKIWQLLNETFNKLNTPKLKVHNLDLIYYYFLWNFFSILGYQPELSSCLFCQRRITPGLIYFDPKEGGLICSNCFKRKVSGLNKEISLDAIKILRIILRKDWNILSRLKISSLHQKQLESVSKSFLSNILPSRF